MRRRDVKTEQDFEILYNKERIKFQDYIKIRNRSDIIFELFHKRNATFGPRNGKHCVKDKMRSVDDYLKLCKFYYPNFTVKNNLNYIRDFVDKTKTYKGFNLKISYCPNISKHNCQQYTGFIYGHSSFPSPIVLGRTLSIKV